MPRINLHIGGGQQVDRSAAGKFAKPGEQPDGNDKTKGDDGDLKGNQQAVRHKFHHFPVGIGLIETQTCQSQNCGEKGKAPGVEKRLLSRVGHGRAFGDDDGRSLFGVNGVVRSGH